MRSTLISSIIRRLASGFTWWFSLCYMSLRETCLQQGRSFHGIKKIAVFVLAAWLVASVVSYYPYYLSYFNEIVWDRRFAYKYLSDSNIEWGQGENYLHDYRAAHPYAIYMPSRPRSGLIVVRADFLVGVSPKKPPRPVQMASGEFSADRNHRL